MPTKPAAGRRRHFLAALAGLPLLATGIIGPTPAGAAAIPPPLRKLEYLDRGWWR